MMLTQRLNVLAHDLAKQCQVTGQCKSEGKARRSSFKKKPYHSEDKDSNIKMEDQRKVTDFYKVGEVIGSGGFGKVYAGTCKETGISVAIKVIAEKNVIGWSKIGDRIVPKEVALLHNLQQECIIKLLDFFEDEGKFYIVMERPEKYIDLFDYITRKGTVSERSARYLFQQVLEAVQYCLSKGVVHRDVKDENILIDLKSYRVKLIDFGSGTFLRDTVYTEYEGTVVYCPPEFVLEHCYHAIPATVWSLGILLYNMLLGDVPFEKESQIALARLSFHVDISSDAESLIRWMLSFRPKDRPSIDQIMNHPWLATTSSSSSQAKRTSQTSTSASSTSYQSHSYSSYLPSSSYCYHSSPYSQSVSPQPQHRAAASAYQSDHSSSSRPASGNKSPAASLRPVPAGAFHSPILTRSQTRQSNPGGHRAGGEHGYQGVCGFGGYHHHHHHHEAGGSSGSVRIHGGINGSVPKTPQLQTRKHHHNHQGSQVTRKK